MRYFPKNWKYFTGVNFQKLESIEYPPSDMGVPSVIILFLIFGFHNLRRMEKAANYHDLFDMCSVVMRDYRWFKIVWEGKVAKRNIFELDELLKKPKCSPNFYIVIIC